MVTLIDVLQKYISLWIHTSWQFLIFFNLEHFLVKKKKKVKNKHEQVEH